MQKKKTAYVSPNIAGILSLFDPALDWSADLSGDEYATALKEFLVVNQEGSQDPRKDENITTDEVEGIREEYNKVRKNKDLEYSVKRTTIKGDKFLGKETKKDAPPTSDKPKLLTGVGNFKSDDVKPADIDPESKQDESSTLIPKRLDGIANSVESIALLLRRQLGLQTKQQRDSRVQQDKLNKEAREDKLEDKPDKKTGGLPKAITKPALSFFEKIKKFFFNIAIGSLVYKMFDWLKDPANAKKITKFTDFLINNAVWILGGLAAIALLPYIGGIMGVLGALKGGLLLLKPALALLFSPVGLAALALAAGLSATLFAMKFIFDKSRDFATGGKDFTTKHKSLDERLREAGMNRGGQVGKETSRGFKPKGTRNAEQEKLFQEVQAERKRLNDLHTSMDNEVRYKIAIEPHDVPARKQGRQTYRSKVSKTKQDEIKTKVEAKYHKMIESGGVAPKEFLTKESTNLLIEKHKKTGETLSIDKSTSDSTSSSSSAIIDNNQTESTDISNLKPNKKKQNIVIAGGGSTGGGGVSGGGDDDDSDSGPSGDATDHSNAEGEINRIKVGAVN